MIYLQGHPASPQHDSFLSSFLYLFSSSFLFSSTPLVLYPGPCPIHLDFHSFPPSFIHWQNALHSFCSDTTCHSFIVLPQLVVLAVLSLSSDFSFLRHCPLLDRQTDRQIDTHKSFVVSPCRVAFPSLVSYFRPQHTPSLLPASPGHPTALFFF